MKQLTRKEEPPLNVLQYIVSNTFLDKSIWPPSLWIPQDSSTKNLFLHNSLSFHRRDLRLLLLDLSTNGYHFMCLSVCLFALPVYLSAVCTKDCPHLLCLFQNLFRNIFCGEIVSVLINLLLSQLSVAKLFLIHHYQHNLKHTLSIKRWIFFC